MRDPRAAGQDLGALLREADRRAPRAPGRPLSLAELQDLAGSRSRRNAAAVVLALLVVGAAFVSVPQQPRATGSVARVTARWLRQQRAHAGELRLRALVSTQRGEQALARTAMATTLYARDLAARGDDRGVPLLRRIATDFEHTRGGQRAAYELASLSLGDHR
jgi:hypothetical protein